MTDVLGIISWDDSRGRKWFRARGMGPSQVSFYNWLCSKQLGDEWHDMPWHGFTFVDPTDANTLITMFCEWYDGHEDEIEEIDETESVKAIAHFVSESRCIEEQMADELLALIDAEIQIELANEVHNMITAEIEAEIAAAIKSTH